MAVNPTDPHGFVAEFTKDLGERMPPNIRSMVTELLNMSILKRYYAFGVLVMMGYFSDDSLMIRFCKSARINITKLYWFTHLTVSNILFEPHAEWIEFDVRNYTARVKGLLKHGMKHEYVFFKRDRAGLLSIYSAASLTFPISILYDVENKFRKSINKTVVYDCLLDTFSYEELVRCEKHYRYYVFEPVETIHWECMIQSRDVLNEFFIYMRKNATLYNLLLEKL